MVEGYHKALCFIIFVAWVGFPIQMSTQRLDPQKISDLCSVHEKHGDISVLGQSSGGPSCHHKPTTPFFPVTSYELPLSQDWEDKHDNALTSVVFKFWARSDIILFVACIPSYPTTMHLSRNQLIFCLCVCIYVYNHIHIHVCSLFYILFYPVVSHQNLLWSTTVLIHYSHLQPMITHYHPWQCVKIMHFMIYFHPSSSTLYRVFMCIICIYIYMYTCIHLKLYIYIFTYVHTACPSCARLCPSYWGAYHGAPQHCRSCRSPTWCDPWIRSVHGWLCGEWFYQIMMRILWDFMGVSLHSNRIPCDFHLWALMGATTAASA